MSWIKGPIPRDGKMYVTATKWIGSSGRWGEDRYELLVAYISRTGEFCTGTDTLVPTHDPEDVEYYLPIPPLPETKLR